MEHPELPNEAKEQFKILYAKANQIQFGKINSRQEGYILGSLKQPRCTSILQMDGSKAGALMEWAKRQVAGRAEDLLIQHLMRGAPLSYTDVSKICAEALREPDKQKDEAADIGTTRHDNFENWLMGYPCEENESLERFKKHWEAFGGICVATEVPVIYVTSDNMGFGGKLDILAWRDGEWFINDNKTSRSIHDSYGCQVSAYGRAVEQMTDNAIKVSGGYIFHIPDINSLNDRQKKEYDKRGGLVQLTNLEEAFEHYLLLLGLYSKRNNRYF